MKIYQADVAILLAGTLNYERTVSRYRGLIKALEKRSLSCFFVNGHASYDAKRHIFRDIYDLRQSPGGSIIRRGQATVVRDLTMPTNDDRPLYHDTESPQLVHDPATNRFLSNKANLFLAAPDIHPITRVVVADEIASVASSVPGELVVVKPVTGLRSRGVQVLSKAQLTSARIEPGDYLLQEFIDTSAGIVQFGIDGVHNLRIISINSRIVGAIGRVGGIETNMLRRGIYGQVVAAENLPESMRQLVDKVHQVLAKQPGAGRNVIAIDVMRGINAQGQQVDVLCEVNRRPLRVCPYMIIDKDKHLDNDGILQLADLWDTAEADLLAGLIG